MKKGRSHSQIGWIISDLSGGFTPMYGSQGRNQRSLYAETLASITPREFVKRDKERKLKEIESSKCSQSLTKLYSNVMENKLSESTLNLHLELAKEETYSTKIESPPPVFMLPTEETTQSLLDIVERLMGSYVNNCIALGNESLGAINKGITRNLILKGTTTDSFNDISSSSLEADDEKPDEKFIGPI